MTGNEWLDAIISDRGAKCDNCGAWRAMSGIVGTVEKCKNCGDDEYDPYEVAENAKTLP